MKKLIVSLAIVVAVTAAVAGTAYAVFTQTKSIDSNRVGTARINLDIRALSSGVISKPLNVVGLIPGQWTDWARAELYNQSDSTPVLLFFHVENVTGDACNKVNLRVTTGFAGSDSGERASYV